MIYFYENNLLQNIKLFEIKRTKMYEVFIEGTRKKTLHHKDGSSVHIKTKLWKF